MTTTTTSSAGRTARPALTSQGRAAVALARLRDGWGSLSVFEQAALSRKLADLAEAYCSRRPDPAA